MELLETMHWIAGSHILHNATQPRMQFNIFNVKLAQRSVRLLARLRERVEVRGTVMASFIIRGGYSP
ncbi:MAG: hypothetical protein A3F73_05900 [Gallionellales bacterium RIFCSPLOWO2_12_FULL_59_22]|nr:MAG: hypothetical protein A3H99_06315 [Gallionellales bacterium RIFCSPLOWO2_02_FULL_59_110]OGT02985.1 MAG: hypothetical protein A2Z65_00065 [Gallionellales bacterium RIFCSPLOWO2_02_58_13]OGT11662.1 MAG: hypothetical protein A3F73_05900 [Gallionellales bacterium RIFCSPLOWO2_12_FULL_59_22]